MKRRSFLQSSIAAAVMPAWSGEAPRDTDLAGQIGVTTGSFMRHLSPSPAPGKLRLLDLPAIMRDELGLKVIDLMTATLASTEPAYLEKLRSSAAAAGCVLTNLKMNNPGIDMTSADATERRRALDEYRRTIDVAACLGVRWVRPLPGRQRPDMNRAAAAYRELMDYAGPKGITLLAENYGWMQSDPDALPDLVKAVPGLHAQPDTGNWTDAARYTGLEKAFPFAVSCDFKFLALDAHGEHASYDLHRCFRLGQAAQFKGPWVFEHFHTDLKTCLQEMLLMKDRLSRWIKGG